MEIWKAEKLQNKRKYTIFSMWFYTHTVTLGINYSSLTICLHPAYYKHHIHENDLT